MAVISKSHEYAVLGGVPTPVLKCGDWQEDKSEQKLLFLIIPGNPGIAEYYDHFMEHLYRKSNHKIPAWALSHTGHAKVRDSGSSKHTSSDIEKCYTRSLSLEEQISAKIEFIQGYVPPDVKLILIGHSIGCYIILRLLDEIDSCHVLRCFLLFPTIERMAESPNGLFFTPCLKYLRWLVVLFVHALSYLSPQVKYGIVKWHCRNQNMPPCIFNASMGVFDPKCIANMLFMAHQEMQKVVDLDKDIICRHLSKLSFYYGQTDSWCPKEYFYEMRHKIPDADLRLCNKGYPHAFVLTASEEVADIVWSWFKPELRKLQS